MSKNNFVPWPDSWPEYRNGGQLCDMIVGPCACGGWHQDGEFSLSFCDVLYRYDKPVVTGDTRLKPDWGSKMKNVTILKRRWESDTAQYVYVPILKGESFADLKAVEKCIMDESFINITNNHESILKSKQGDVFLIITPDCCKILRLVATEFRPEWNDWGDGVIEI